MRKFLFVLLVALGIIAVEPLVASAQYMSSFRSFSSSGSCGAGANFALVPQFSTFVVPNNAALLGNSAFFGNSAVFARGRRSAGFQAQAVGAGQNIQNIDNSVNGLFGGRRARRAGRR